MSTHPNILMDGQGGGNKTTINFKFNPGGQLEIDLFEALNKYMLAVKMYEDKNLGPPPDFLKLKREHFGDFEYSSNTSRSYPLLLLTKMMTSCISYIEEGNKSNPIIIKNFDDRGMEVDPIYTEEFISHDNRLRTLIEGAIFFHYYDEPMIVRIRRDDYGDHVLDTTTSSDEIGTKWLDGFEQYFYNYGCLKGAAFDTRFNFFSPADIDTERIVLDSEMEDALHRDIIDYIPLMSELKSMGLPDSRGLILAGPPGTGKTMCAKYLMGKLDNLTRIVVAGDTLSNPDHLKYMFEMSRKLSPTLMVVEDIDSVGGLTRAIADHPLLSVILQEMDGIGTNNGVVVVATTNHLGRIDWAISDRPGRFDRIIEVGNPSRYIRQGIIQKALDILGVESSVDLTLVSKQTEGLTAAWCHEVARSAWIRCRIKGRNKVTSYDLKCAVKEVCKARGISPNFESFDDKKEYSEAYS
jgi:hypothetical protein